MQNVCIIYQIILLFIHGYQWRSEDFSSGESINFFTEVIVNLSKGSSISVTC